MPDLDVRVRDLDVKRDDLTAAIEGLRGYGSVQLSETEAMHALRVTAMPVSLTPRYGRRSAKRVTSLASELRARMAADKHTARTQVRPGRGQDFQGQACSDSPPNPF
jgi:hypothetical protein